MILVGTHDQKIRSRFPGHIRKGIFRVDPERLDGCFKFIRSEYLRSALSEIPLKDGLQLRRVSIGWNLAFQAKADPLFSGG